MFVKCPRGPYDGLGKLMEGSTSREGLLMAVSELRELGALSPLPAPSEESHGIRHVVVAQ